MSPSVFESYSNDELLIYLRELLKMRNCHLQGYRDFYRLRIKNIIILLRARRNALF